jgi:hypothetical protein
MDTIDKSLMAFAGALCVALLVFVGYLLYDEFYSDKFYLRKDQWECQGGHTEDATVYTKIGSVDVPQTVSTFVCDAWGRKK